MRNRDVVGRRIVHVEQGMVSCGPGRSPHNGVMWIELEDGTRLVPITFETEDVYGTDFVLNTTRKHATS